MSLSKYSKKVWIPDVGSKPHQPLVNFKFPYREFGKQKLVKRAFQHSWFAKWKWLHYEEDMDKAFCYNCIQAYKEDKLRASNLELAFISKGFNNWKDASVKFKEHESSNCHKDSMIVTVDLPSSVKDIAETLQRELTKLKSENRQMLLKILSNIRFLARQSIAIRGDGDEENSNFIQLFKLRGEDDPKFAKWLEKKTDNFALFWSKVTKKATQLNIDEPALPRKRKRTVRYESGNAAPEFHTSIEGYYRQAYFEVLDVICSTIEDRFRQLGYQLYSNLEQLLLKAVCKENYSSEFDFVTKFYGPDLNVHALEMQLQIFATNFIMEGKKTSIKDILKYLRNISSAQRALLSEICIIAKLILVMPATNAVSERSFSALRRVKTYLRSTMKQTRSNHLMILHVHKDITDSLNLNDIGNEFVRCSEHRLSVFGHF